MTMQTKADRPKAPKFTTEAEEAKWWDGHKEMVEENLIQAIRGGTARQFARGTRVSRNVTIRLAEADLDLARQQAEEKGLPYQTYIKSVLHEELVKRGLRRAS